MTDNDAAKAKRPKGYHIEHRNHDKSDNSLTNIRYCTPRENYDRGVIDSRYKSGNAHPQSKLTIEQAAEIKNAINPSYKALMKKYGVKRGTINCIRCGRTWAKAIQRFNGEV